MVYKDRDHTFAVCAHKESPYLEEAIQSLVEQTVRTNIILATSTPNAHIRGLAEKYNIPLYINSVETDATGSWTFAIKNTQTPLITIVHQDDTFEPSYAEKILKAINQADQPIIAFTDYSELRNGRKTFSNKVLNIKRFMLMPIKWFPRSRFIRRRILSLGNPICCPSVTYVRKYLLEYPFSKKHIGNQDWAQWETLSKLKGSFVYVNDMLTCHRIHEGSATSEYIGNNLRADEDYEFFCKFWPKPIARILVNLYETSEKSNDLR